jgi:HAE1 family hydrophobic/amphiphilic exporter-1
VLLLCHEIYWICDAATAGSGIAALHIEDEVLMSKPDNEQDLQGMIISDTSIKQPVFITMLMLLTIVVGLLAFRNLPVDLYPEINPPVVFVSTVYPGAGPETVADQVAEPLEEELGTLNGVVGITSTSAEGFANVIVEFEQEIDTFQALQDVRDKVEQIRPQLPRDIEEPVFQRFDPAQAPILTLAITSEGDEYDLEELRTIVEDEIAPRIQSTQGVGSVGVSGGLIRQINVQLDLNRLTAYRILPAQVSRAIENANTEMGLGDISVGNLDVNLRAPSTINEPADIGEVGIPGTNYDVGDVASIEDSYDDVEEYSRLNGEAAISMAIRKQSGTNTVDVAENALLEIEEAFADFPALSYEVISDQSELVRENVNGALEEIFFAILFAMLVVLFFFRDLRNTLVTVLGLPVIMIGTFAFISLFGLTINIITLLALSVTVGLVIDDAIVVRENIFRHMERGQTPKIAASRGTAEVSLAVLAMTLTIIAVFLPVAFTTGVSGIIFGSFGITVAAAMALSLFEAFTLAPMLSAYWFKQKKPGEEEHTHDAEQSDLPDEAHEKLGLSARIYERMLAWTLRHRLVTLGIGLLVVLASIAAASGIKVAFFPEGDAGEFGVGFEMPPGTNLETTNVLARQAEEILLNDPDIELVMTTVGGSGGGMFGGTSGSEVAEFYIELHEDADTIEVQDRLREQMPESVFPEITFAKPSFTGTSIDVTNRPIQIQVRTSTGDLDDIAPVIPQIITAIEDVPGLTDVDSTYTPGKPEIQFLLRPDRASDFNISNNDMARTLQALIDGDKAATFRDEGRDHDIIVRLQPGDRQDVEGLRALRIPINGQMVPLVNIATVELDTSATSIRRSDQQIEIIIGGNNTERNINEVQADIQARLDTLDLPENVAVSFGGNTEDQAEGFQTILMAMGLSVVFVYMVLASQFGSFLQPLVIMIAMPLSFLGAFMGLRLVNVELTIFGMIGMVLLLGLVTKNSILLVDFTNRLKRAGLEKNAAIIRAGGVRLRPILMTSIAIMMGNLPAAIGFGEGAELRRGLAVIVIGGLITSTLLTLVFVPVAYSLLESFTSRFGKTRIRLPGWRRKPAPEHAPGSTAASATPGSQAGGTTLKLDDLPDN